MYDFRIFVLHMIAVKETGVLSLLLIYRVGILVVLSEEIKQ